VPAWRTLQSVLLSGVLLACGGNGSDNSDLAVLSVQVLAGPACPPTAAPPTELDCDAHVAEGVSIAVSSDGKEVARSVSDENGRITVELPPGTYTIEPLPTKEYLGTPEAFDVDLSSGSATTTIVYDTGVRQSAPPGG
jgi:hypothetical protein